MLAAFWLALTQNPAPPSVAAYDRRIPLVIDAGDALVGDHGRGERAEYRVAFSGTLHVWTSIPARAGGPTPALELQLLVEDELGRLLVLAGGATGCHDPYARLAVEPGQALVVRPVASTAEGAGELALHFAAAPETEATRKTAADVRRAITEIRRLTQADELARAREEALLALERATSTPGAETSDLVCESLMYLGVELSELALLEPRRAAWEHEWRQRARTLPDCHGDLQRARVNLSIALSELGDPLAAHPLIASAVDVFTRTLPADDFDLQRARLNLALVLADLDDLQGARALEEQVLEVFTRTLPDDSSELQAARGNFAVTLQQCGDLHGARALEQKVVEVLEATLPEDHPDLQLARANLAGTTWDLGDVPGARALFERVLEVHSRTLPDDHPDLQIARRNLALTLQASGDLEGARALEEQALEVHARTLPEDHPDLQWTRLNLAGTLAALGDLAGARALETQVLEILARTLPDDHPDLQRARSHLAATALELGDLEQARALYELLLAGHERTLPDDHPRLQDARRGLAGTLACLASAAGRSGAGTVSPASARAEQARCAELVSALGGAGTRAARAALLESAPREAEERCSKLSSAIDFILTCAAGFGGFDAMPELDRVAFVLSETTRGAGISSASLMRAAASSPEHARQRARLRAASEVLARLAQEGTTSGEFQRALAAREGIERELIALARSLPDSAGLGLELDPMVLASRLAEGSAVVALRRYSRGRIEDGGEPDARERRPVRVELTDSLCAFVLAPGRSSEDGARSAPSLTRVELGPLAPIEEAVNAWRARLGATSGSRGLSVRDGTPSTSTTLAAGRLVRRLVLDPLLPALGGADHLVLASDDVLHLVPLDALPLDEEPGAARARTAVVGDRWRIETRVTLTELLADRGERGGAETLVAIGDVSYAARAVAVGTEETSSSSASGGAEGNRPRRRDGEAGVLRGGAWSAGFDALPGTGAEVRGLARVFRDRFGAAARPERDATSVRLLTGTDASREALFEQAPGARWLHVATHGWFAPDSIPTWNDLEPIDRKSGLAQRPSGAEQVKGMSPMLLCGLALAGASAAQSATGHVPGLVTAEELSTVDLARCELAVLSACDTNVGERRAGQGVHSLQKALQMAGARSVITSLWKVPDEATKELMLEFYRRLWVEREPKWRALWGAKTKLREARDEEGNARYAPRDWAAWVLTGAPD